MSLLSRPFDLLIVIFMIVHIPTTILVDSQSVVPRHYYPKWAVDMLDWHIKVNNDHLVSTNPNWFVALVYCEVAFQLPFFFIAAYAFAYQKKWIRIPALVYGVHTATTLVPILADIITHTSPPNWTLGAIYFPYLLVPLALAARMAVMPDPFPGASKSSKKKSKAN
mmetsp:Transcript_31792/g.70617  ORF Transcript_31792/g.70617 Transcript_31792/m.70617 type:complete len:166 (+) Transcript_31792:63-560(+)|eukprot:CAMPEP_0202920258 /NCGR_PEP_ID=MMETSP1392-20130828/76762_1 /ASSEMBLY_ACC=CAM_ASM_000868 /TAXON_ID=225041 /ORGANISM="Chlamydomonas chlamydogama, Strain SAG 11-48b" /LENGTH=165 /DNA_ID=CAMNT_0049613743 /DNA_START=43 /DNA_END=540 /DNA_ORIENTATION=-